MESGKIWKKGKKKVGKAGIGYEKVGKARKCREKGVRWEEGRNSLGRLGKE